jgi:hypothetical protein
MNIHAQARKAQQDEPGTSWDRHAARLLALLEYNRHDAVTITTMREHGIETPAQVIYALQLGGYDIDRAPALGTPCGPLGHRLRRGIHGSTDEQTRQRYEQPMSPDAGQKPRKDVSSDPATVHAEHNARPAGHTATAHAGSLASHSTMPAASRTCALLTPAAASRSCMTRATAGFTTS